MYCLPIVCIYARKVIEVVCLFCWLFVCSFVRSFVRSFVCLFVCLLVCLFACLLVCLFACFDCVCLRNCFYVVMYVCMYTYVCTSIENFTYICMYTYPTWSTSILSPCSPVQHSACSPDYLLPLFARLNIHLTEFLTTCREHTENNPRENLKPVTQE